MDEEQPGQSDLPKQGNPVFCGSSAPEAPKEVETTEVDNSSEDDSNSDDADAGNSGEEDSDDDDAQKDNKDDTLESNADEEEEKKEEDEEKETNEEPVAMEDSPEQIQAPLSPEKPTISDSSSNQLNASPTISSPSPQQSQPQQPQQPVVDANSLSREQLVTELDTTRAIQKADEINSENLFHQLEQNCVALQKQNTEVKDRNVTITQQFNDLTTRSVASKKAFDECKSDLAQQKLKSQELNLLVSNLEAEKRRFMADYDKQRYLLQRFLLLPASKCRYTNKRRSNTLTWFSIVVFFLLLFWTNSGNQMFFHLG